MRDYIKNRYKKIPTGTIISFAGSKEVYQKNLSDSFLICNGKEYNKNNYEDLYSVIGTIWGGTGTPNFNIPDLCGRFLRGADLGEGIDPDAKVRKAADGEIIGNKVGGYQEDALENHKHSTTIMIPDNNIDGVDSVTVRSGEHHNENRLTSEAVHCKVSSETRPKNAAVLFIIKC